MRIQTLLPLLFALALGACGDPLSGPQEAPSSVTLEGVTLIDGTGGAPQSGRTILVEDGRISAIYPDGEIPVAEGGIPTTLTFPLYEQEGIQYFSAGLGKEERRLSYPPFSLKLIFVQGERAYLAGVSIHLVSEDGTRRLKIPGEEVEGPWLFINIPTGTYLVSGTNSNGTTIEKTITVQTEKLTVVHFRFP